MHILTNLLSPVLHAANTDKSEGRAIMVAYTWNAPAGGDWDTAANWTPASVPGIADTTDFATGGNAYTVTGDGSTSGLTVDADQVTFEGTVVVGAAGASAAGLTALDDATITVNSPSASGGPANFTVSSLSFATGTLLQNAGLFIDEGGGLADVVIDSGLDANMTIADGLVLSQLYVNEGATYAGDVTLADGGSVTLDTSASFGAGTLSLAGSGSLYAANATGLTGGALGLSTSVEVSNTVTLATDAGAVLTLNGPISGGIVDVNGGWVELAGANTYSAGTVVDAATLTLTGASAAGIGAIFLTNAVLETRADSTGGSVDGTVVALGANDTVFAGAGNLLVYNSTTAGLIFAGGTGASTVVGGAAPMYAVGGAGGGVFFAGSGGHDTLVGGSGAVELLSSAGGTLVAVGSAQDILVAGGGNTTLSGGYSSGNDLYFTSGTGATLVQTGSGFSTVVASGALNAITGTGGTEDVFLQAGFSQLDFANGYNTGGTVNIIGFGAGDNFNLSSYAPNEAQSVLASATVSGGNTILQLSDNEHIVLFGVTNLSVGSFT